jgi:hypothetical protein
VFGGESLKVAVGHRVQVAEMNFLGRGQGGGGESVVIKDYPSRNWFVKVGCRRCLHVKLCGFAGSGLVLVTRLKLESTGIFVVALAQL